METGAYRGYPGNGGPVALVWFPVVLEADFESEKTNRTKTESEGGSGIDLSHGDRESNLGSAAHPRRGSSSSGQLMKSERAANRR